MTGDIDPIQRAEPTGRPRIVYRRRPEDDAQERHDHDAPPEDSEPESDTETGETDDGQMHIDVRV
ncbi:MAG TPA: hypothetical protein VGM80_11170 [Gaiellaceae bacterium]